MLLVADEPEALGGEGLVRQLARELPSVRWCWAPPVADEPWFPVARTLRHALDYVRFLEPRYDASTKLRARTAGHAPRLVGWLGAVPGLRRTPARAWIRRRLMQLEHLMPLSDADLAFLRTEQPDLVLLTSMTYARAAQLDHHKAARALGLPVGYCVMSWDHLSSKSLLHLEPDRLFVWNDVQRREVEEMHPVPADRIVVTGAQCYDQWFTHRPSRPREDFCAAFGFDPVRAVLLYVCSAMSPPPDPLEPVLVRDWIAAVRASDDLRIREASILIRPHPERTKEWREADLSSLPGVFVQGRNPIDAETKAEYFDMLYHSAAVVGVCTTAFIEATVVGRPVFALLAPPYRMHQDAMRHFRYLTEVEGGVLQTADALPGHVAQLTRALDGDPAAEARRSRFVRAFLRPQGLDVEATPRYVDAIEDFLHAPRPAPLRSDGSAPAWLRLLARRLVVNGTHGVLRWLLMDPIDVGRARAEQRKLRGKRWRRLEKLRDRRRRARSLKKQVARVKTQIKRLLGIPVTPDMGR